MREGRKRVIYLQRSARRIFFYYFEKRHKFRAEVRFESDVLSLNNSDEPSEKPLIDFRERRSVIIFNEKSIINRCTLGVRPPLNAAEKKNSFPYYLPFFFFFYLIFIIIFFFFTVFRRRLFFRTAGNSEK